MLLKMICSVYAVSAISAVVVAAPRDRQQQEEHREAGQRVEHAGDADDRADQPPPPAGHNASANAITKPIAPRPRSGRGARRADRVAVEVVDDPPRAELVLGDAGVAAAIADLDLGQDGAWPTSSARALAGGVCSSRLGEFRKSEMISTESTPTSGRGVHHRPVLRIGRSRSESASRSTCRSRGSGPGPSRVARAPSPGQVALGHPSRAAGPRRRRRAGTAGPPRGSRTRAAAVGSPTRTSGAFHRSMSRTRSSDSRFSARSAPTKSSTKSFAGLINSSAGESVLCQHPALLHDGHAVAHLDRLVDVVGDEQDRLADLRLEPQKLVLEPLPVDRVDGTEGLVHQHQRWVRGERTRHPDPLSSWPQRQRIGVAVRIVRRPSR